MPIHGQRLPPAANRTGPVEPYLAPVFVLVLLTASCLLASFALACATPFAAFAVLAAATLPLASALPVVAAAWIVNQTIGFGALGYPINTNTILWGIGIGVAALIATAAAALVLRRIPHMGRSVAIGLALLAAYAIYEMVLFALTPALGGAGAFTLAIVGRLAILNILWMNALSVVCWIVSLVVSMRHRLA